MRIKSRYEIENLQWQCQEKQVVHLLLLLHKLLLLGGEGQGEDVDGGRRVPDQGENQILGQRRRKST